MSHKIVCLPGILNKPHIYLWLLISGNIVVFLFCFLLKMLVDVFAPEFKSPKNIHLKNFFIILAPLVSSQLLFICLFVTYSLVMTEYSSIHATLTDPQFCGAHDQQQGKVEQEK